MVLSVYYASPYLPRTSGGSPRPSRDTGEERSCVFLLFFQEREKILLTHILRGCYELLQKSKLGANLQTRLTLAMLSWGIGSESRFTSKCITRSRLTGDSSRDSIRLSSTIDKRSPINKNENAHNLSAIRPLSYPSSEGAQQRRISFNALVHKGLRAIRKKFQEPEACYLFPQDPHRLS
jgi:hypothetical protein